MPTPPEPPEGFRKVVAQLEAHLAEIERRSAPLRGHLEKLEAIYADTRALAPSAEMNALAKKSEAQLKRAEKAVTDVTERITLALEQARRGLDS
jgi:exonuclease VII small subunit